MVNNMILHHRLWWFCGRGSASSMGGHGFNPRPNDTKEFEKRNLVESLNLLQKKFDWKLKPFSKEIWQKY